MKQERFSKSDQSVRTPAPELTAKTKAVAEPAPAITSYESAPIRAFFSSLDERRVRYCHWKSNIRLAGTLAGSEDIDLLVHPAEACLLQKSIADKGFKLTVAKTGSGHPAVFHALALDEARGALVDLHAYHQLVSGDSLVKSYRFPVEEQLLANVVRQSEVNVPLPSAELVLFVLRILLKHTSLIEVRKVNRNSFAKSREELSWLLARSDVAEADAICRSWFPTLSVSVAEMIAGVADPRLVLRRIRLGLQIDWDLRRLRRLGRISALLARTRRVARDVTLRSRRRHERCLLSGGAWIAFAGPKGTGKTTIAGLVSKALGRHLDVWVVHPGKPPPSLLSLAAKLLLVPAARAIPSVSFKENEDPLKRGERRYSMLYVLYKLLLARDRQRLLTRVMRAVTAGTIVISDRCPATNYTGIDGSAFDDLAVERAPSQLQRRLMEKERLIYRSLPRPRLVVKLAAELPVVLQRDRERNKRGGPVPKAIHRRWELESQAEFDGSRVVLVDAGGTLDGTRLRCVEEAWSAL